ncbi:transposase [Thermodesulfovibrio sp. 3907-1M]
MNKFPDIQCDQHIIMPNHIHFIIINVRVDLRVCPNNIGEHTGSPLQKIIQWFKTMTTNEYIRNVKNNGWKPFDGKLWQRNYY